MFSGKCQEVLNYRRGSLGFAVNYSQVSLILSGTSPSISNCEKPMTLVNGLFSSWAIPEDNSADRLPVGLLELVVPHSLFVARYLWQR